ncbi:MAG: hypothetical protein COU64_06155 [Candidatus Pacebacteria bacterium CG10_big_fil_rev_8_21_14_0_10_40_26]|uniref:Uncharacterized protein n=1 Tax=Candidatus Roizmanbacteria bacterium CG_4_10_14_0_2_um_filter_39_13 TaxID=1974825 RepID=A0A2M7U1Z4_9BACT|nr:MAG: hypothetical protein COU64_06155 [Candidatus Pacebacteria bacterium CG10_big_fil_rev_8_21_14_0_10_40_26]PIZ64138.1 MAG: hypothetical protein COY16_00035 [Candidatus Roizmanbacteria bacterium CG_4_10_14_0_2_um_filter_39_13]
MKNLPAKISILDRYTHGYFKAKNYFNKKLKKEVFITIFDTKNKISSYGYIFLCERNVLIFVQKLEDKSNVLLELEKSDSIESVVESEYFLTKIFNLTPSAEKNLDVVSTHSIKYLLLNQRYLILCDIQASLSYGEIKINYKTIILNERDYCEKVDNASFVLKEIIEEKNASWDKNLPGMNYNVAIFNIYLVTIGFFIMALFLTLSPLFLGVFIGGICWITVFIIIWRSR